MQVQAKLTQVQMNLNSDSQPSKPLSSEALTGPDSEEGNEGRGGSVSNVEARFPTVEVANSQTKAKWVYAADGAWYRVSAPRQTLPE